MTLFLNTLGVLALASFTPTASAYIPVPHTTTGLSNGTRTAVIIVCVLVFILLIACCMARNHQNRRAAAMTIIPLATTQVYAPNPANSAGYNAYTSPPTQAQGQYPPPQGYQQSYGQPPQGMYAPPAYGPGDADKGPDGSLPINVNPQDSPYPPPGSAYAPPLGPPSVCAPPPGPPGVYSPPTGYDAAPPPAPVPPAHTTGQDHFRP
ncbi:hypothetical protein DFH09DRAFT_411335 [Mycena vulgaris]|nr:hypothetical protein DFH09DRAFT_411335 [Mycena vulgaris]